MVGNRYKSCRWKLYKEQLDFRYCLYQLSNEPDLDKAIGLSQSLINRVVTTNCGYFASSELERPFLKLSKLIDTDTNAAFEKNSFLHVMTQCYTSGGHTRVVERWIESSPVDQKHTVLVLEQKNIKYPQSLQNVTYSRNGKLIFVDSLNLVDRAKFLRDTAVKYEYVILHVHMWDPTPIVAFGKQDFTRPVILFNHADNSFWCCSSIVDMLADIRDNDFAKIRGIRNRYTLRIPFEINPQMSHYIKSKKQSRIDLGLPLDKMIILTVGGNHKYSTFEGIDFCGVVYKAIFDMKDVICVGVGPSSNTGRWNRYKDQFIAVGVVAYGTTYFDYLNACDIYVNSIPLGGGTAMLDAVQFHKPVVSYSIFRDQLGDIVKGIDTVYDETSFIKSIRTLLLDNSLISSVAKNQYDTIVKFHGIKSWTENLNKMISITPKKHSVNLDFNKGVRPIDELSVMSTLWYQSFPDIKFDWQFLRNRIKCLLYKG